MNYMIEVDKLTKSFNGFVAVNEVSFKIKKGEIFGLLGPNGAGKTTTISMLSTLLKPSSGTATINGHDIYKNKLEVRRSIGVVFQTPSLDGKLTARENLTIHALLYGMRKDAIPKRINELLKLVDLYDKADVMVENFSGGMKRRLEIARGLMHRPKVLFLDEPTLGLDAQTRRKIWEYIKELNKKEGMSIILTTHYMEEADRLCDRVAIIDRGKIIVIGTSSKLKDMLKGDTITMEIKGDAGKFMSECEKEKWISKASRSNSKIMLIVRKAENKIPKIMAIASRTKTAVKSITLHKPSLEDVFLHFTGRSMRDEEEKGKGMGMRMMMKMMRHG